jgi:hypothetical protein
MKKIIFMMLAATALASCSEAELASGEDTNVYDGKVELTGVIDEVASRGDGMVTAVPTDGLPVAVYRADMSLSNAYSGYNTLAIGGNMATDGKITMTPAQKFFPSTSRKSKFISVYPNNGTFSSSTVAFAALDGKTDVMCTNLVEGYKGITTMPTMTFSHLLTGIEVWVKAKPSVGTGETVADIQYMWGQVQSITVTDKSIGAVVTLPAATGTGTATIAAAAGTGAALSLWNTTTHAAPGAATLDETATAFGYALFLPTTGTSEALSFSITTQGGDTQTVTASAVKYEAAKKYKITLSFTLEGTEIDVVQATGSTMLNSYTNGAEAEIDI